MRADCGPGKNRAHAHMRFVFQTMMSSRIQPKAPGGAGGTLQFTMSDDHRSRSLGDRPMETRCFPRSQRRMGGGARRDRTDDLMLAKHALYQLSYGPIYRSRAQREPSFDHLARPRCHTGVWWAQADSNCRPHAYQACALTN